MLSRRHFLGGAAALAAGAALPVQAAGPACPAVPEAPRRIVAIDYRIDVEPALVLGVPLIAGGYADDRPWVPFPETTARLILPAAVEHILTFAPDLIICCADTPERDWWPYAQLQRAAPTLPTSFKSPWQADLRFLAGCLGLEARAEAAVADYEAMIAAMRARHARVLADKRIASVLYSARSKTFYVHAPHSSEWLGIKRAMLDDLGVRTVEPGAIGGDGVTVSAENIIDVLGEIDAIVVGDVGSGGLADLDTDPLWRRLPAVAAGHVRAIPGNSNYGSLFTARFVAGELDALLSSM
jgi:ABC-type Fe3+-hydroxamate transport system substrate-binding protein